MQTIGDILKTKGKQVWSVKPETKMKEALLLMAEKNVGALLVLNDTGKLEGIISERDYARKAIEQPECPRDLLVKEIMTSKIFSAKSDMGIETCMALMTNKKIRHVPVIDGDTISGMISIGDVVKASILEKEFLIQQMEQYIWKSE